MRDGDLVEHGPSLRGSRVCGHDKADCQSAEDLESPHQRVSGHREHDRRGGQWMEGIDTGVVDTT
jgi:hypothetical protein